MDSLHIKSNLGTYDVTFLDNHSSIYNVTDNLTVLLVDKKFYTTYPHIFKNFSDSRLIKVEASEEAKNLINIPNLIDQLLKCSLTRDHKLLVIGGGTLQDIGCFISQLLFRGLDWNFVPTTLLAQADSCVGSKSSINFSTFKNVLGGFYPPKKILINTTLLRTLDESDYKSGVGEIIKVHVLAGPDKIKELINRKEELLDPSRIKNLIYSSLKIKKSFIEEDEFDKGKRLALNYGHSFGHAIESATGFMIPHGIAVNIGLNMANYWSYKKGYLKELDYLNIMYLSKPFMVDHLPKVPNSTAILNALVRDKKNKLNTFGIIAFCGGSSPELLHVERNGDITPIVDSFIKFEIPKLLSH